MERCYWCLKRLCDDWIEIEGFCFCNEQCEKGYYDNRQIRKEKNLPPLLREKQ